MTQFIYLHVKHGYTQLASYDVPLCLRPYVGHFVISSTWHDIRLDGSWDNWSWRRMFSRVYQHIPWLYWYVTWLGLTTVIRDKDDSVRLGWREIMDGFGSNEGFFVLHGLNPLDNNDCKFCLAWGQIGCFGTGAGSYSVCPSDIVLMLRMCFHRWYLGTRRWGVNDEKLAC